MSALPLSPTPASASASALLRPATLAASESLGRSITLAVLAHALLLWALAFGVHWRANPDSNAAEAELWAVLPQAAAPRAEAPPEPPAPDPQLEQAREAQAQREVQEREQQRELQRQADVERQREADIAEAREKERKERQRQQAIEEEKKRDAEKKREQKKRDDKAREEQAKKEAQQRKDADQQARQDAARQEAQRRENLRRMQGLAGASGGPQAQGNALQSAGPSAGYAGRIKARIKPNITLTEPPSGNPTAEVEVRTAPDGLILSRRLIKASGDPAWDQAVLRAIDKTERLPRDEDGRVPPLLVISFRPND